MPLITVMLKFTLQSFQLNLTLNQLQIKTPLRLDQSVTVKWIIFWNYSIQNTMNVLWTSTYRLFKLDWWSPLVKKIIQYLLCCFIETEERMFQSQIVCHTFLYLSQPRKLWNWLMETRDIPKESGLFYVAFLTVQLYTQLDQFIIVQVTLPTWSNQVP